MTTGIAVCGKGTLSVPRNKCLYFFKYKAHFEDEDGEEGNNVGEDGDQNRPHGTSGWMGGFAVPGDAGDGKSLTPTNGYGSVEETSFMMNHDIDNGKKKHNLPPPVASSSASSLVQKVLSKDASAVQNHGLNVDHPFGKTSSTTADAEGESSIKSVESALASLGSSSKNYGKSPFFSYMFIYGSNLIYLLRF